MNNAPVTPDIAVIMPHYRCENFLARAVTSILKQKNVSLQLVFVDDASPTDDWKPVLAPFLSDRRLHVFRTNHNVGPYRIFNWFFRQARAPFLAFQDADDYSDLDRLWLQMNELEKQSVDIVGSAYFEISELGDIQCIKHMPRYVKFAHARGQEFGFLPATTTMRRSVLQRLGGVDGTTHMGADTEFSLRAMFACKIRNVQRPLYYYRRRAGSLTTSAETGYDSPARVAYAEIMQREHRARWTAYWKRRLHLPGALPLSLTNRPNDVEFDVSKAGLG